MDASRNTTVDKIASEAFEKQDMHLNRRISVTLVRDKRHAYTPNGNAKIQRAFEARWGVSDLKITVKSVQVDFSFTPSQLFIDDSREYACKRQRMQAYGDIERLPGYAETAYA